MKGLIELYRQYASDMWWMRRLGNSRPTPKRVNAKKQWKNRGKVKR